MLPQRRMVKKSARQVSQKERVNYSSIEQAIEELLDRYQRMETGFNIGVELCCDEHIALHGIRKDTE